MDFASTVESVFIQLFVMLDLYEATGSLVEAADGLRHRCTPVFSSSLSSPAED